MKKILTLLLAIALTVAPFAAADAATKIRGFTALEGDTTGTLDRIDIADLTDGDIGLVVTAAGGVYFYVFDADDTTTSEQSPFFIYPNDYTTTGVWKLTSANYLGRSALPAVVLRDSGAADFDDNFKIYANCDDGSCASGSEDVDVYFQAQVGGTAATTYFHFDCDASGNCDIDLTPAGTGKVDAGSADIVTTGTLSGKMETVVNSGTAAYSVTAAQANAGTFFLTTNTATTTYTLPAAAAGYAVCAKMGQGNSQILRIDTDGTDFIVMSTGARTSVAGDYYGATADAKNQICAVTYDTTDWYVTSEIGTWTEQ